MQCPKCHRPLDDADDGVYICCADAVLQWRCTRCAKVSDGFAFPYGRCPQCGGELEMLEAREIDDASALEGIRKAFEIELGGQAFYRRAAADTDEPILRELFEGLARMESEHMQTLARRYHADLPADAGMTDLDVAAVFGGVVNRPADPANLFRIAIALENRASAYFADYASRAAEGSTEQQLYRELAAEEREHVQMLSTEYARWQLGKPGLLGSS
ncbi:MAG: ferritin family protein [Burkholderiaceae bacterium]|jgi:rubrerythrin|nr:ferritin family protein [Burkholderiaceae bacterium]